MIHIQKTLFLKIAIISLIFSVCLIFPACQTITNPVTSAETVEQKAYGLYGTFVIFEEAAAKIVTRPSTPLDVVLKIKHADAKAKPVFDSLNNAIIELNNIRSEYLAGKTTIERLDLATDNLKKWVDRANPAINDLIDAIR